MASYRVLIKPSAAREIEAVDQKKGRQRLVASIRALADEPRPIGSEKLSGQCDRYRIRLGRYRVVYSIADDDLVVLAVRVADRKDIYRQAAQRVGAVERRSVMKAFVVANYGKSGLCAAEVLDPVIGARDVLVRVSAASINPLDKMVRNGELKLLLKYKTPFVLGHDVAGVVARVGAEVRDYKVGDEVYARPRDLRIGAFAEYIAIDHADIALKPSSLTMEESGAVPLVALAAWQALADLARVKPGQKVLVHAGAGGLGSTVIQLARHLGAYVATTARGNDEEKVRDLGASEVIDYTKADFAELLSGYDVVLDSLSGDNLAKSLTVLKPGGLAISVVGPPDAAFAEQVGRPLLKPVMAMRSRKVRAQARKLGVRYSFFFMRADGEQLKTLAALYDAGTLRPVLDRTFPFDETLDAMAYVEQGRAKGKIVVAMPLP